MSGSPSAAQTESVRPAQLSKKGKASELAELLKTGYAEETLKQLLDATKNELKLLQIATAATETRNFENWVGRVVADYACLDKAEWEKSKDKILEVLEQISVDPDVKFAALYALCMRARLDNDLDEYEEWLNAAAKWEWATSRGSYEHLWSMFYSTRHDNNQNDLERALEHAKEACNRNSMHVGFIHNQAEVVAKLIEDERLLLEDVNTADAQKKDALKKAESVVWREPGYAKFWATQGRLQALCDKFKDAEQSMLTAIRKEHGRWDSDARRAEYKVILTQIRIRKEACKLRDELAELDKRANVISYKMQEESKNAEERLRKYAEESKTRHTEILAFFVGILSIIAGSIQIIIRNGTLNPSDGAVASGEVRVSPDMIADAAALLMLAGILLVAFGGFGWLLRGGLSGSVWRFLSVAFLGSFVFVLGPLAVATSSLSNPVLLLTGGGIALTISAIGAVCFARLGSRETEK